jgi:hypothetical protein
MLMIQFKPTNTQTQVLKEMLDDELLDMVGDPHDTDPPEDQSATDAHYFHHHHHHPHAGATPPHSGTPVSHSAGASSAPGSPTSGKGGAWGDRARWGVVLSAHSSLASIAGLAPPTVDEESSIVGGFGKGRAPSHQVSGTFAPPGAVEEGQSVYDAGVWRSATARKERKRYARSLGAHKHTLSAVVGAGRAGSSSSHQRQRLLKGHGGHEHRPKQQQHHHHGAGGDDADDGGFHL